MRKIFIFALVVIFSITLNACLSTASPTPASTPTFITASTDELEYIEQMIDILYHRSNLSDDQINSMKVPLELSNLHNDLLRAMHEQNICLIQGNALECMSMTLTASLKMEEGLKQFMYARNIPWPTAEPQPTSPPTSTPIPVGSEAVSADGLVLSITDVDPNAYTNQQVYKFSTPPFDGQSYFVVAIKVKNSSPQDVMINPDLYLIDATGKSFRTGCGGFQNMLQVGKVLKPGEEISGLFCISIPQNTLNYSLRYYDVNLGLPQ